MKSSTPTPTTKQASPSSSSTSSVSAKKSTTKMKRSNSSTSLKSKGKKSSTSSSGSQHTPSTTVTAANQPHQQSVSVQTNLNHLPISNEHASPNSSGRDKSCQKTYVGINASTVKCVWEQQDNGEIELNAEILPILAEDASYKLRELANHLKTFTRHSGGKLTTDIVNEVLKDCNVPPVIGARAGNSEWNRLDCDGTYYYHADEIIDLREEYLREIRSIQCGPLSLESNWVSNQRNLKDLTKLWKSIILAIIMGDDVAFQYTIHTTLINPFIGCILPYLIQKAIEYLTFGFNDDTLDRLLRFLKVIVQNYHVRDVANNEEYFNLCNIFVCLLLGPINMKANLDFIKSERIKMQENDTKPVLKTFSDKIKTEYESPESVDDDAMNIEKVIKDEVDYSNDAYSKLVVNPVALGIKKEACDDTKFYDYESNVKFEPNYFGIDYQEDSLYGDGKNAEIKTENFNASQDTGNEAFSNDEIFSPFVTDACDDRFVDDVCMLLGYMASKWGYFEHETIYLLSKRMEIFFYDIQSWSTNEFKWLQRIVQALTSLGEAAFRELTLYFEHIPYEEFPEWLKSHMNYGAIYIHGRKDHFFYEYMEEVCGDGLQPFMLYYGKYIGKMINQTLKRKKMQEEDPLKIATKVSLKTAPLIKTENSLPGVANMFPERTPMIRKIQCWRNQI